MFKNGKSWTYIISGFILIFLGLVITSLTLSLTAIYEHRLTNDCRLNLMSIGKALQSYSNEYGEYPPFTGAKGLDLLIKHGFVKDSRVFNCPKKRPTIEKLDGDLTENYLDYAYFPALKDQYKSDTKSIVPVLWDKRDNHDNCLKTGSFYKYYRIRYLGDKGDWFFKSGNVLDIDGYVQLHIQSLINNIEWQNQVGISDQGIVKPLSTEKK